MFIMNNLTYIFIGILVLLILYIIYLYNSLVKMRFRVKEGESDIEVQLKRRHDLIPNLIETVKGYAAHEKTVFENVTQARAQAIGAHSMHEKAQAENMLSQTLKTLFALAENYPELKANANFLEFQRELADTENKIQASRRFYNANVRDYNIAIDSFPTNIVASIFNFQKADFFDMDEGEKEVPKVGFKS